MKGKFILLSTLLLLLSSTHWLSLRAATYELQSLPVKDYQVSYDQVKDGDIFAFNSGMWNYTKTNPWQDVPNLFLSGRTSYSSWAKTDVLGVLTGLTSDNLFQLETAPDQTNGDVTYPSFYLKHVDSGKYVANPSGYAAGQMKPVLSDVKSAAISFSFQSCGDYPKAGGGYTDYMNDLSLCLIHYDEQTCYFGPAWNYGFAHYSTTAGDCIPWNVFVTKKSNSAIANLQFYYGQVQANSYTAGTDPGFYPEDKVTAFNTAKEEAASAIELNAYSEEEAKTLLDNLYTAYLDVDASAIPISTGYYNIVSAYSGYESAQNVKKGMSASNMSQLTWGTYDPKDPTQLFKITVLTDSTYSIQNIGTTEYANTVEGTGDAAIIPTTKQHVTDQTFTPIGISSRYNIANVLNTVTYFTTGHQNGAGISGNIIAYNVAGVANSGASWYLRQITDQKLIDSLVAAGPQKLFAKALQLAVDTAGMARAKTIDYTALLTKGSQMTTNSVSTGDSGADPFTNLIDGNTGTIFHSVWSTAFKTSGLKEGTGWHNIQFNLPYAISKMKFNFTGRESTTYADTPNFITILGTNDSTVFASTATADSMNWTKITDMTEGFPNHGISLAKYASPIIDLNGSFKYLRFVMKQTNNQNTTAERTFNSPEVTGVTWNLSELQLYDGSPAALSEYNTVNGMKEACDALDALIAAANDKITNHKTIEQADIDALKAATKTVNGLYVDRDALDTELSNLLDSAKNIYNEINPAIDVLIKKATQMSSNSASTDNSESETPWANLIDNNLTTVFHSCWLAEGMQNENLTEADWAAKMATYSKAVGTGYHNLQINLNRPVSNFFFNFIGRGDTEYHDTPNDIEIYATNDATLGASVLASESEQWTKITELVLDTTILKDVKSAKYTSPKIELGNSYKYIRFVVKGTTHMGKVEARTFKHPEITGITWNLMEFHMYKDVVADELQYNYVPGMKEAGDAMKALTDEYSKIAAHTLFNKEPIVTLRAAVEKVYSLYADTTELATIYQRYKLNADSSVVNEGIGFVDSQASIDAFSKEIADAKASVDNVRPTVETISAAIDKMDNAYAELMKHVGQIVPNQWYNILSGSTRAALADQPIFLGNTSVGYGLSISGYPIGEIDPKTDMYAIFRFVPVEGNDGQYYIQSLGTGQYFGKYRGLGGSAAPLMSHEKAAYKLYYYGNGKFSIVQADQNVKNAFKTDTATKTVFNWNTSTDSQQAWKFGAVSEDQELSIHNMKDNSIRVMTMPFEMKGDLSPMMLNEGIVSTYAIKSITVTETGTRLELSFKTDFEAGEPCIMTVNDYTKYDAAAPDQPIAFAVPATVTDTSSIVANGLVGTLQGLSVKRAGLGIFTNSVFTATGLTTTSIAGRGGYIDPKLVATAEGDADLVIEVGDLINSAKGTINTVSNKPVNVYSASGVLEKSGVKASEATKDLQKGIYLVGKKKIAVK